MAEMEAEAHTEIQGKYKFIQVFAKNLAEANNYLNKAIKALDGDGHVWLCYPKGTSKKYQSDLNRNKAWEVLAPYDFEPVSLEAIDDDWSALRFRHVDKIKTMKRKAAATDKGRERIKDKS